MASPELHPIPTPEPPSASDIVQTCIAEINEAVHSCKGWAVEAGLLLFRAKAKLPHGQWTFMFESSQLRISLRVAEMLMRIAGHPTLANPKYFSYLPEAWSILYELSKLPSPVLEREIQTGSIHPELTLIEAKRLVERLQGNTGASQPKRSAKSFNLERQRTRLTNYLDEVASRWPKDQRSALADLLEQTARKLRVDLSPARHAHGA